MEPQKAPKRERGTLGLAVKLVFVVGVIAVTGSILGVRQYTAESARFCRSCHEIAPEVGMWLESEHRDVVCQSCHHPTLEEGLEILWVYLLGAMPDVEHANVRVASCSDCHESHDRNWTEVVASTGHQAHTTPEGLRCTDCHGHQMHFGEPEREICLGCHEGRDTGAAHEPSHCLACHDFLSSQKELRPGMRDCMRCHLKQDRPIVLPPTAPMHFNCAGCHIPHAGGAMAPCSDCHRSSELCGLHEDKDHQACGDCHEAHGWTSNDDHCWACHKDLVGHYPEKRCKNCHGFERKRCVEKREGV